MKLKMLLLLAITISIVSCGPDIVIKESTPPAVPDFRKYQTIFIGWLDLGEERWRDLGYATLRQWQAVIDEQNTTGFQVYLRDEYLKGKKVSFAQSKDQTDSPEAELLISFKVDEIERNYNAVFGGTDWLHVTIIFTDAKTKTVLYQVSTKMPSSNASTHSQWTFSSRLNNSIYMIAMYLDQVLTQS